MKAPTRNSNDPTDISKVKDLIIVDEHRWNEKKLQQHFTQSEVMKIMEIHLSSTETNSRDKLLWTPHPSCDFSAKSYLRMLADRQPSTSTRSDFPWKRLWKLNKITPKMQMFIWRILKNGLAVGSNMQKHIKGINSEYKLCNNETETIDHLFIHCQATQAALFASPMNLRTGLRPTDIVQECISSWLKEGGDYSKMRMGACMFWAIWKTRNNIIFNKGKFDIHAIIKENVWEPPKSNTIKINFDGDAGIKGFAYGAIARDYKAGFQGYQSREIIFTNAVEAEAYGALLGTEMAVRQGRRDVVIEGDALNIINTLKCPHLPYPWRIQYTVSRIRD
ncbi:uncharacterized protein LOC113279769 [Papaver somniferum]|uniref:uncharacterized protein LOC113279769 n=1 Tax=Papaver somniferum TaxID=3469 RepID=UPI000E6F9BFF|nr:uncharacterized protein LOC113279769 [Papaver somniferum]